MACKMTLEPYNPRRLTVRNDGSGDCRTRLSFRDGSSLVLAPGAYCQFDPETCRVVNIDSCREGEA